MVTMVKALLNIFHLRKFNIFDVIIAMLTAHPLIMQIVDFPRSKNCSRGQEQKKNILHGS